MKPNEYLLTEVEGVLSAAFEVAIVAIMMVAACALGVVGLSALMARARRRFAHRALREDESAASARGDALVDAHRPLRAL